MPGKPPGSIVSLYIDSAKPLSNDDIIRTRTGRCYRVLGEPKVQARGKNIGRQRFSAVVQEPDFEPDPDEFVLDIYWYSRNRKR